MDLLNDRVMSSVFPRIRRGLIAIRDTCPSRKTLRCNKESVVPGSGKGMNFQ